MSIVNVTITEDSGTSPRVLRFRLEDSAGGFHDYGPMFTVPSFDAEAFKPLLAAKVEARLAETEADQVIGQ